MSYIRPVKTRGEGLTVLPKLLATLTDTKKAKIGIILHKLKSNYVEKRHLELMVYDMNHIVNI